MESDLSNHAAILNALGNSTRLEIVRLLRHNDHVGMCVGDIQAKLSIPWSTLSHHLNILVRAHVVSQLRDGRNLMCAVNKSTLEQLAFELSYLNSELAAGNSEGERDQLSHRRAIPDCVATH